ncbi:MAG: DUF6144 family protein [Clostridia bacterium]|nr:DUF6144 family protein [Clostridia bacterium]
MNKALRLMQNADAEISAKIRESIGDIDENATPLKQAGYINRALDFAGENNICMRETLRKCGVCCISNNAVKTAKKLYAKSGNTAEFLEKLNGADIGGKNLRLEGDKIIAVYKKCYCNIPKKTENMNPTYCECSAGWYEKLFSEVFERAVNVKIINTILNGADECSFEITEFE